MGERFLNLHVRSCKLGRSSRICDEWLQITYYFGYGGNIGECFAFGSIGGSGNHKEEDHADSGGGFEGIEREGRRHCFSLKGWWSMIFFWLFFMPVPCYKD